MVDYTERFQAALAYAGLDLSSLADKLGVSYTAVKKVHDGQSKEFKASNNAHAARILGVNSDWLAIGKSLEVVPASENYSPDVVLAASDKPASGYVRLEHLSPQPSMGRGHEIDDPVYIVQYLDVLEDWVRRKTGTTDPSRIKVLTGIGRSMRPTIEDEDLVFVDTGCREIDHPDIYVISIGNRLLLKRALILVSDQTLVLRSDNTEEFPDAEKIPLNKSDSIHVAGKVKAWWTLKK